MNNVKKLMLVLIVFICFSIEKGKAQLKRFENEPELNMKAVFKSKEEAQKVNKRFYKKIKLSNKEKINYVIDKIKMSCIRDLHKSTDSMVQNLVGHNDKYVTFIMFYMGLNKDNKSEILLQTGFTKILKTEGEYLKGKVQILNSDHFLLYNGGTDFTTIDNTQAQNKILRYQVHIRIRNWFVNLRKYNPDKLDIKGIIIPFQEFFCLFHVNYNDKKLEKECKFKEEVNDIVYDVGSLQVKGSTRLVKLKNRHTVMFNYTNGNKETNEFLHSIEPGDVANLGNMCPPSCDGEDVKFKKAK